MQRHSSGALLLILNCSVFAPATLAASDPWFRYDNPHFITYSNAAEKETRQLLEELETFRAAFLQIGNVAIPASTPETIVLITDNKREFSRLTPGRNTAGFAFETDGKSFIVMPATGGKKWSTTVIRHEYGHVLLRHKKFPYPSWYEEGFAELVSATQLTDKGASFMLGKPPDRAKHNGPPLMEWNFLVSDEFNPHQITDARLGSSAYAQAWLLAHFMTLGKELRNAPKLQKYFDLLKEGVGSTAAFEEAFEATADELWVSDLKAYTRKIPVYTFKYLPGAVQTEFSRVPADDHDVLPLVDYLQLRSLAFQDAESPEDALALLPGSWAPLSLSENCAPASRFVVDGNAATMTVETDYGDGVEPVSTTFSFTAGTAGDFVLVPVANAEEGGDEPEAIYLKVRAAKLFCWGQASCGVPMRKCGS